MGLCDGKNRFGCWFGMRNWSLSIVGRHKAKADRFSFMGIRRIEDGSIHGYSVGEPQER